jgi:hypothetical protein
MRALGAYSGKRAMTRLLLATLLYALGTTPASAQTVVSQGLLELGR